jgi:hypothetical protein
MEMQMDAFFALYFLPALLIMGSPFAVAVALFTGIPTLLALALKLMRKDDPLGRVPVWLRITVPHGLALWLAAFLWLGHRPDLAFGAADGVFRSLLLVGFVGIPAWLGVLAYRQWIAKPVASERGGSSFVQTRLRPAPGTFSLYDRGGRASRPPPG